MTSRGRIESPLREVFLIYNLIFIEFSRSLLIETASIIYNQVDFIWTESNLPQSCRLY